MKRIEWDDQKNKLLKEIRGVSFEEVEELIQNNKIIEVVPHPNQKRYPGQEIAYVNIRNYIYFIPFVRTESELFLKTIVPSRVATKKYLKIGGKYEKK